VTPTDVLLYASLACCAAFYVLAGIMYSIRRPPVPPTLPAMSDLGPEAPALANLLAHGGAITADAVPGTLFDLAARRVVEIDETEPHTYVCRLTGGAGGDLAAHESRVMALLRSKAAGGVVPAGALTLGSANEAKRWLRGFRSDVSAAARARGLCKPRWPRAVLTLEGFLIFGALILVTMAGSGDDNPEGLFWGVTLAIVLATAAISTAIFRDDMQIVTPTGLSAQARWLSLRKYLHDDELFSTLPPTAVVLRERYLAYGAALGVAAAAVRAIPMGAESDHRAWSSYTGTWRQVRVSYPRWWPPAYGASPGETIWRGIRVGGVSALVLFGFYKLMPSLTFAQSSEQVLRDGSAIAVLIAAAAVVAGGAGLCLLLAGVVSLFGTRTINGSAIRLRRFGGEDGRCYLAVDDGTSDHVRAWKLRPGIYLAQTEYTNVTATVTPLLSYVRDVQPAPATARAPVAVQA
jgi:hypothetical protein